MNPIGSRPFKLVPVAALILVAAGRLVETAPRSYDIKVAYIGFLSEYGDACDIQLDPRGYDSLIGTVTGVENPAGSDEDVVYKGRAKRKTNLDYCLTKPKVASKPDELVYCSARLTGAATMDLELTIYSDSGKGAWLKANPVGNADSVRVKGDCTTQDQNRLRDEYPGGTSAASPDGQPIFEARAEFTVRGVRRLGDSTYYRAHPPETAWDLRVKRATP